MDAPTSDRTRDDLRRAVAEFRMAFWSDRARGESKSLSHYVARWSVAERFIAREYLAAAATSTASQVDARAAAPERVGPYVLVEEIGRGGQGRVYRATDTRLGRTVALKILTGLGPRAEDQLRRFRREAEIASRIQHPGICTVHDAGLSDGIPFIAMRHVEGRSLSQVFAERRDAAELSPITSNASDRRSSEPAMATTRLELDRWLAVFEKIALALHAAHEAGVIHRDVKPANIMITPDGDPVILDFGLAHDDSPAASEFTRTGEIVGTPSYLAPEQISGARAVDRRTDVYALGVSLFECLTLCLPFQAPTHEALYRKILTEEAPDPRRTNRAISVDLGVVIQRALTKDPMHRYSSAHAFAADLTAARRGEPVTARPLGRIARLARLARRYPARTALASTIALGLPLLMALIGFVAANAPDIETSRRAARIDSAAGRVESAFYELHHGDLETARHEFELAADEDPESGEAIAGLILVELAAEDPSAALRHLRAGSTTLDGSAALYLEAGILAARGDVRGAERMRADAPPPRSAIAHFTRAVIEMARGHATPDDRVAAGIYEGAVATLRRAIDASSRAHRIHYFELLHAASHAASRVDVSDIAAAALRLWPDDEDTKIRIGRAFVEEDPLRAASLLEQVLTRRPRLASIKVDLSIALARCGRSADAKRHIEDYLASSPSDLTALSNLAVLQREAGDFSGAYSTFERIRSVDASSFAAAAGGGACLDILGRTDEAIEHLERARDAFPSSPTIAVNLALACLDKGRIDDALALMKSAAPTLGNDLHFHLNLGQVNAAGARHGEALAAYARAAAIAPNNAEAAFGIGSAHLASGNVRMAFIFFERAALLDASHAEALCNTGLALAQFGDARRSLEYLCRGHDVGKRRGASWLYPSEDWIRQVSRAECRRLVDADESERAHAIVRQALTALPGDPILEKIEEDL